MVPHINTMKTVRIIGSAGNTKFTPSRTHDEKDVEVWLSNSPTTTLLRCPRMIDEWTRWFNLHSKKHILGTYPSAYSYYQNKAEGRPIYLLRHQPDIPTSIAFPRKEIQAFFATPKGPNRYFTCSVCWLIALAIYEGFERIELWGFELRDTKPGSAFAFERPCFTYWMKQATDRGIEVIYQKAIQKLIDEGKLIPGDPDTYDGKLYGYGTKAEVGWDESIEDFREE